MNQARSPRSSALLALLVLAVLWGYNWIQMKVGVQYAPPFTFAALRVTLSAVVLLLALAILRKPLRPKESWGTFWVGTLQVAGIYGLASWALVSGGAGKVSVLVYTMPFWTLILAGLFLKERIRGLQWFAIGLGAIGLLFILEPQNLGGSIVSKILAVLAGLSWAGGAVIAKRLRQKVDLDLLSFTTWQTVFGAIPLVTIALLVPGPPIVWSPAFVAALAYTVLPGTAIALLLWIFVLSRLSAGTASLGILLNPVIAVLVAWAQLGEQPGLLEAIGMGLIAVALVLNALQAMKPHRSTIVPRRSGG